MTQTKYIVTVDGEQVGPEYTSRTAAILLGFRRFGDTDKDLEKWKAKAVEVPSFSPEIEKAVQNIHREFDSLLRNGDMTLDFSKCKSLDDIIEVISKSIWDCGINGCHL